MQEEERRGGKKGRLLGIITLSDVLRYIIGEATIGEAAEQRSGRGSISERRPSQDSARPISVASENPLPAESAVDETPVPEPSEEKPPSETAEEEVPGAALPASA